MNKTSAIDAIRLREDVSEIEWEARVEFAAAFQICLVTVGTDLQPTI